MMWWVTRSPEDTSLLLSSSGVHAPYALASYALQIRKNGVGHEQVAVKSDWDLGCVNRLTLRRDDLTEACLYLANSLKCLLLHGHNHL